MNVYLSHFRLVCGVMLLSMASFAHAQDSYRRAVADVDRLLEDARSAYENFELDQAESDLNRAIRLIDRYDMRNTTAAEVFVQIGIVVFAKKRDSSRATEYFQRALEADPRVELDRNSANPSMERLFETARARARRSSPARDSEPRYDDRRRSRDRADRYDDPSERRDRRTSSRAERDFDDRRDRSRRDSRYDRDEYDGDRRSDRSRSRDRNRDRDRDRDFDSRADDRDPWRDSGRRREQLNHNALERAQSDKSLELWVSVDPDTNREIYQLFVYFRSAATTSVQKAVMRAAGSTEFRVTIPRRYVVGREFVYYFVAEARSGRRVATLRSASSPFKVRLTGDLLGGASRFASGSSLGDDGGYGYDVDGDNRDEKFAFSLGTGTGVGFVTRASVPVRNRSAVLETEGLAVSVLHLLMEMDAWMTDTLSIGAFGRIQVVEFATLVGGRFQYRLNKSGKTETRLRLGGGYGKVRHLVKIQQRNDTTLDGPFCVNAGFVYLYRLSDAMKFKSALDYLQLFGESPSYHADLSFGIELSF